MTNEINYYDFKTDKEPAIIIYASELMNDIDPTEKIIYYVLKMFSMGKESAYPAIETMGRILGISEKTVRNKINGLIKKGLVWKKARYDAKGRTSNLYITYDMSSNLRSEKGQKNTPANNHESRGNTTNNSIYDNTTTTKEKSQTKNIEVDENISKVREIVKEPLTDEEVKAILNDAKNSLEVIKEKYEIIKKSKKKIDNVVGMLICAIRFNYKTIAREPIAIASNEPNRSNKALDTYKSNKNTNHVQKAPKNSFNAFPQRNYTPTDYAMMEQRLLNK